MMDISDPILAPLSVGRCPSCSSEVLVDPLSWNEFDNGIEICEFHLHCAGENYESKDWRINHGMAYEMPYVYWLPVEAKVEAWLKTIRFTDRVGEQRKLAAWNSWAMSGGER